MGWFRVPLAAGPGSALLVALVLAAGLTPTRRSGKGAHPAAPAAPARPGVTGMRLPLVFEANQGQADPRVRFLARGNGYGLYLTATEAVLGLRISDCGMRIVRTGRHGFESRRFPDSAIATSAFGQRVPSGRGPKSAIVRMQLVGADPGARVQGADELAGRANHLLGSDPRKWRTNVPLFERVRYRQVYPGIDLVYYGGQGGVEHDFVVAAGADPGRIRLRVSGAKCVSIDRRGDLALKLEGGAIRQKKPLVYQEIGGRRREVSGRYVLDSGTHPSTQVSFALGAYDHRLPLVIDPVLVYSTYLGGAGDEESNGIALDALGNAYITGLTASVDYPTKDAFQPGYRGNVDTCVTKLDAAGALVYSTYLGGSGDDEPLATGANAIAVDSGGNAYVTGTTNSTDFPVKNAAQPALAGRAAAFVVKLDHSGALVYSTYLGGSVEEAPWGGIAVNASGSACVSGRAFSHDFPTKNAVQPTYGGNIDTFVTMYSPEGGVTYSTYLGGSADESVFGTAVDSDGNAYVTGSTASADFPTSHAAQPAFGGAPYDAYVTKFDPGGAFVYSTYLGGSGDDQGHGLAADDSGYAYVLGATNSANFPTRSAAQASLGGDYDAFFTRIDPTGALVYSTYLGGSAFDRGEYQGGVVVDGSGSAYVIGDTQSANFPTLNAAQPAYGGNRELDGFVARFGPNGALRYSTYLGGSGLDAVSAIAIDPAGDAFVTGWTSSADFPTKNPIQAGLHGSHNAFVVKYDPAGALDYSTYLGGSKQEYVFGIAANDAGDAYVVGTTSSADFPTANAAQPASGGGDDLFVAKLAAGPPPAPVLTIEKAASPNAQASLPLTYTITVRNTGNAAANNVVITDPLQPGPQVLEAIASQGTPSLSFNPDTGVTTVTDNAGTLAAGAAATLTIVVRPVNPGQLDNTASASADGLDPVRSTTSVTVAPAPPAGLTLADCQVTPRSLPSGGGPVTISAAVTDDARISGVFCTITYLGSPVAQVQLAPVGETSTYSVSVEAPANSTCFDEVFGIDLMAFDDAGRSAGADCGTLALAAADTHPPSLSSCRLAPSSLGPGGGPVTVSAAVTDDVGVAGVFGSITHLGAPVAQVQLVRVGTGDAFSATIAAPANATCFPQVYAVSLTAADAAGNQADADCGSFRIAGQPDTQAPAVAVSPVTPGALGKTGGRVRITARATDNVAVRSVTATIQARGGGTARVVLVPGSIAGTYVGTYLAPRNTGRTLRSYTVSVAAKDAAGNTAAAAAPAGFTVAPR